MKQVDHTPEIFNNLSLPVLVINRDYRIVKANDAACDTHQQNQQSITNCYCYQVTHNRDNPCWQDNDALCPVREVFATRKRAHTIHKHFQNHHITVEVITASPIEDDNGEINYVIEEFQNITGLLDLRDNILSICATCKKILDNEGNWRRLESYFHKRTGADFSHGICPECLQQQYPEIADEMKNISEG